MDPTSITNAWQLVGWMVLLLVASMGALITISWYALRIMQQDKLRMGQRVTALEDVATSVLRETLTENSKVLVQLTGVVQTLSDTLKSRTCLLAGDNQDKIIQSIGERIAHHG